MKWLLVKLVMMAVVMAGLLNYALYLKTGKSPLANIDWSMPKLKVPDVAIPDVSLPNMSLPDFGGNNEGEIATVYKWVDADGVINYSQTKPEGVNQFDTMEVDPNTNLVQGEPIPEPEPEPKIKPKEEKPAVALPDMNLLPTPDRVQQLMQDAQNIQTQMNDRTRQLEQAIQASGAK